MLAWLASDDHRRRFGHRRIRLVEPDLIICGGALMPEVVLPAFLLTIAGLQIHWFLSG
jgi:hypothetical protein